MELVRNHPLHDSYNSVANLNNPVQLDIFCNEFPELLEDIWVLEEKFHGFNFQVTYSPGFGQSYEPNYAGSREIQVTRDTEFYGAWAVIDRHQNVFQKVRDASNIMCKKITLYMEIFGGKVSHGVDYGVSAGNYKIRFFGAKVDEIPLSPKDFYDLMSILGIPSNMYTFPIAFVYGAKAAAEYNPVFHSFEAGPGDGSDRDRSFAEGFVAKPFHKHYVNKGGKTVMFKMKNPLFEEYAEEKIIRILSDDVLNYREIFKCFLNAPRINSAFSKIGHITSKKDMAKYIKYITDDARKDFFEQYGEEFSSLSTEDQKSALNVGSHLASQLLVCIETAA